MHGRDLNQPVKEARAVCCRYEGHLGPAAVMTLTPPFLPAFSHTVLPQDPKSSGKQLLFVYRELVSVCPCGSEVSVGWNSDAITRA